MSWSRPRTRNGRLNKSYQPLEHALIYDPAAPSGSQLTILTGQAGGVDPPAGVAALAHTHPLNSMTPTNGDMRHIITTNQSDHVIVTGKDSWALIETTDRGKGVNPVRVSEYKAGKHQVTSEIVDMKLKAKPNTAVVKQLVGAGPTGANPNAGTHGNGARLRQSMTDIKVPTTKVPLGLAAAAADGVEGAKNTSRASQAWTGAKNVAGTALRAGSVLLTVGGAAVGGFQIGDGANDIANGETAQGASKMGFGALGLGLDIGGAYALKTGAMVVGGSGLASVLVVGGAAVAAGGSIVLAQQTVDAAIHGEKTPYEVASDYWVDKALVWTGHDL